VVPSTSLPSSESLLLTSPATPKASNYIISAPVSVLGRQTLVLTPTAPSTPVSSKITRVATASVAAPATHVIQIAQPNIAQPVTPLRQPVQQVVVPQVIVPTAAAAAAAATATTSAPAPVAAPAPAAVPAKKGLSLTVSLLIYHIYFLKTKKNYKMPIRHC
jgi:hypothetical protein